MTYFVEIVMYFGRRGQLHTPACRLFRRGFRRWGKARKMAEKMRRLHQETQPGIRVRVVWYTMTPAELIASREARAC